jgi:3-hydroxybutyryl-CoA dehydrogenase
MRGMLTAIGHPPRHVKVTIVGGGVMGHAIAAVFLAAGNSVAVYEENEAIRTKLRERVEGALVDWKGTGVAISRLEVVSSFDKFDQSTYLIVEAVPENLGLKQDLFQELEMAVPGAILATNSSVYRVGDVAKKMRYPSCAVGMHWWNPPHLIPVVEVIQGDATLPAVVEWTMGFLTACGKTPVHVRKDTPGFIGNRLQHALWREALALVEEGVADAKTVDLVVRNTIGLKLAVLGPIENADYVGLDMTRAIHEYVFPVLSRAQEPSPLLNAAIANGALGAKTGQGLLEWPEGRREDLAERLGRQVRDQLSGSILRCAK